MLTCGSLSTSFHLLTDFQNKFGNRELSGFTRGAKGEFPPVGSSAPPPLAPLLPTSEEKCTNQSFSANLWIFAPSETHFLPSMPPAKQFLVPPLITISTPVTQ